MSSAELAPFLADAGLAGVWRRFLRNPAAVAGGVIVVLVVALALFGPLLAPGSPIDGELGDRLAGPSGAHLLGTDALGRDQLSRLLHGGRTTVLLAAGMMAVTALIAVLVGLVAGFLGGVVDAVLMRLSDIVLAFPSLVLALAIAGFLGPGLTNMALALVAVWWASLARVVRGQVVALRGRGFMDAAVISGGRPTGIVARHVLRHVLGVVTVLATHDVAVLVLAIAGLSFLGLGASPPSPEWGRMLFDAKPYLATQPLVALVPGIAITLTAVGFTLAGDGLRDALDPTGRS
ncbi:MAG: ABC transporter permease [Pseudonocardiaceae bacterium]